jgi:hypothetical protein
VLWNGTGRFGRVFLWKFSTLDFFIKTIISLVEKKPCTSNEDVSVRLDGYSACHGMEQHVKGRGVHPLFGSVE